MPANINNLADGWLELESDPGLFTLLLEDMGVKGVQVEEIYDLQKSFEGKVYGFIFLFRWIEERRSRRKIVEKTENYVKNESIVNNMFFAQQMVPNSCATHSLVSVLLNCSSLDIGPTLSRLRAHTLGMNPENKGWAIGNTPELANAHNSHAAPQARRRQDKASGVPTTGRVSSAETFHFVSYVPISGHLFELDGLKPFPIDHGPWHDGEDWTEKFRRVITERLGIATGGEPYHDIRFNLMAVVPDNITAYREKLHALRRNCKTIVDALHLFIQNKYPHYLGKEPRIDESSDDVSLLAVAESQKMEISESDENQSFSNQDLQIKTEKNLEESKEDAIMDDSSLEISDDVKLTPSLENLNEIAPGERISGPFPSDFSTPLTIETSLAPPVTPSTDTASEIGSSFNSPLNMSGDSTESSPALGQDYQKLVVVRIVPDINKNSTPDKCVPNADGILLSSYCKENSEIESLEKLCISEKITPLEDGSFAPSDLFHLITILEKEIKTCEGLLKEELEKRKRYRIDDCRRTHSYDQFIITFLAMLAEQGKLGELVKQQLQPSRKRPQPCISAPPQRNSRPVKKESKPSPTSAVTKKRGRKKAKRKR